MRKAIKVSLKNNKVWTVNIIINIIFLKSVIKDGLKYSIIEFFSNNSVNNIKAGE